MRSPIQKLARLRSYDEALKFMQKTAPTRGMDYTPLGERRYHGDYYLRRIVTADSDKIVVYLFATQLIEFTKGTSRVTVNPMGLGIHTTSLAVLKQVLLLQCDKASQGKFVVYTNAVEEGKNVYQQKIVMPSMSKFYIAPLNGNWELLEKPVLFTYHLNKRETNIVRESTRRFRDHVELMLKVRDCLTVNTQQDKAFPLYIFPQSEFEETFGGDGAQPMRTGIHGWFVLIRKPTQGTSLSVPVEKVWPTLRGQLTNYESGMTEWQFYRHKANEFMRLITSEDTTDFYKAMLIVAHCATQSQRRHFYKDQQITVSFICMLEALDEIILKANSNKCFSMVEVPQGVVPTDKYTSYVFWQD